MQEHFWETYNNSRQEREGFDNAWRSENKIRLLTRFAAYDIDIQVLKAKKSKNKDF